MGKIDTTLFIKTKENDMLLVQIYVDDIIFSGTNVSLCEEFSKCIHSKFEMSMMGELNFFLRLQIKQLKEGTFINKTKYIRDLLKRFNMEEAKVMKTPMSSSIKLDKDEKGKSIDSTMYRGMIGSLLYLTASRPDIMYIVCLCARFHSCPKESHLSVVKRILRYLKGTMDIRLWYPKSDNFELIGFSDADFACCRVERKNTSGTCHFLGHFLVSWHSKKQNSVALSMVEAKYIAADLCCAQILCMKQTLSDFELSFEHVPIKCGHRDEVSYLEAFLVDSILMERWIHMGYLMMMHMISCCESTTRVLTYDSFLTRVFTDVGVDLSGETDFEALSTYDTYDEQSLGRMKFEKAPDGS
uniref:Reverse transcriptase Ty1/copia-type domain-containing protein n=1 Tax=Vitis vinifera TaxID=29760 RepID=A5C599_VITVI|nr:hypothetical protein VITISV_030995 [Vitis vinifera]